MQYSSNLLSNPTLMSKIQRKCASYAQRAWSEAKRTRKIRVGPVNIVCRLAKAHHEAQSRGSIFKRDAAPKAVGTIDLATTESREKFVASGSALLVGVGSGLGVALTKLLASKGMQVSIFNRRAKSLNGVMNGTDYQSKNIHFYPCDATDEREFRKNLDSVVSKFGVPDLVIYLAQGFSPGTVLDTNVSTFEDSWRANCLGAFVVGKFSAEIMVRRKSGTIIFAGATSGTVGRAGYVNLAIGKFGLRALSQVMARELWPQGIHVAHVVIDADIAETTPNFQDASDDTAMNPMDAAQAFYDVYKQPKSAWSQEFDLRPWNEQFWEHC